MLQITHFSSVFTVLCAIGLFDITIATSAKEYFYNEGDISYADANGTLSSGYLTKRKTKTKCAAKCLDDLLCNAIVLCTTPSGLECRLSRGWKNTGGVLSGATCNRFQIVRLILCSCRSRSVALRS